MPDSSVSWPNGLRAKAARSRAAPLLALGIRMKEAARYDAGVIRQSASWVWKSREYTNYTYDLTALNMDHLCWWVAAVTQTDVARVRQLVEELHDDEGLAHHVRAASTGSAIAAGGARFGRRYAWYALVRLLQPALVVEAGTHQGLGSLALAAALMRNGQGRLITIDTNPLSGQLLRGYEGVVSVRLGSSLEVIPTLASEGPVGLFIHDSLHTYDYESAELATLASLLAEESVVLSDNSHNTRALSDWAESTGRQFLFFGEQPLRHWYPGGGVGAAWNRRSSP